LSDSVDDCWGESYPETGISDEVASAGLRRK
jgi:hypothetical protein